LPNVAVNQAGKRRHVRRRPQIALSRENARSPTTLLSCDGLRVVGKSLGKPARIALAGKERLRE